MIDEGILEYNGHRFSPRSHVRVSSEIVYSEDERTAIYHRHRITVDDIVVPSDGHLSTSLNMGQLRSQLSEVGRPLTLKDKGWGYDLQVNVTGEEMRDVEFGPKPRILTWSPIGHTQAAEITWECETCIPVCIGGIPAYSGLASFVYDMSFSIDERGYTTRTVTGHILIAMTRDAADHRNIPDSADQYRDIINVGKPDNFQRVTQDYRLSADKRRLDFTIVDRELESRNAWPEGVLAIEAEHTTNYVRRNQATVLNSISMQCALAPDQESVRAWEIFKMLVNSRLTKVNQSSGGPSYFLMSLDVIENIFKNQFAFRITYKILEVNPENYLVSCDMFATVPTDWHTWTNSIEGSVDERGIAGLEHTKEMDRIVDLCDGASPPTYGGSAPPTIPPKTDAVVFRNTVPPNPVVSWLVFDASLTEETYNRDLYSVTLGRSTLNEQEFDPNLIDDGPAGVDEDALERKIAEAGVHMRYRWKGYAERAGYKIPNPGVLTIGEIELIPTKERKIARRQIGLFFGVPVYAIAWDIVYVVKERPNVGDVAIGLPADDPFAEN
jgi:hypothetical protein